MKIYTKTGDTGRTGLIGGSRVLKQDARIEVIGNLDELNAVFGVCIAVAESRVSVARDQLIGLQSLLFDLGAEIACAPSSPNPLISVEDADIAVLEEQIDWYTGQLPELRAFILPGGSLLAAHLHVARGVARRLERSMCSLHATEPMRTEPLKFVNRLSDWIFCVARYCNHTMGIEDVPWTKRS